MGYNKLSGSIIAPEYFGPGNRSVNSNILLGDLSSSNGAEILNIPRLQNATNNAVITNVAGDENQLYCESRLQFDGSDIARSILTVTGEITASIGISSSYFEGNGSRLTGINAGAVDAAGPIHSVQVHDSVDSSFTGSSTFLFQNDILKLGGGLKLNRTAITATMTASATNYYIGIDTSLNPIAVRLPDASALSNGQTYVMKDEGGVSNTNNITILASGSQTIDGQNTIVLESPYASIQLYCNGTDKFYIC
tara:strand:+ start:647 stop:1399 length:753 start_codon:yes stop_codon:yes gene_type:complete